MLCQWWTRLKIQRGKFFKTHKRWCVKPIIGISTEIKFSKRGRKKQGGKRSFCAHVTSPLCYVVKFEHTAVFYLIKNHMLLISRLFPFKNVPKFRFYFGLFSN